MTNKIKTTGVTQAILPGGLLIDAVFFRARLGDHIPAVQGRARCKEAPPARRPGRKEGREAWQVERTHGSTIDKTVRFN